MANFRTLRTWNYLWERLNAFASGGSSTGIVPSPFGASPLVIDEATTLYVDLAGDDSWEGTSTRPFRSVTGALNYLKAFEIAAPVTVQIGPGQFDGFGVPDLNLGLGGTLTIAGTMSQIASGTTTTTTYRGAYKDVNANFGSVPVGAFLTTASGGSIYYSIANIVGTDTLETLVPTQPAIGTPFQVWQPTTEILTNFLDPSVAIAGNKVGVYYNSPTSAIRASNATNITKTAGVCLTGVKIVASDASTRPMLVNGYLTLSGCDIAVRNLASSISASGVLVATGGTFRVGGNARSVLSVPSLNRLTLNTVVIGGIADAGATAGTWLNLSTAPTVSVDGFVSGVFIGFATPIVLGNSTPGVTATPKSALSLGIGAFGATTVISATGPGCFISSTATNDTVVTGGASNGTWLSLSKGARFQVGSAVAPQGTTELSVDGVTSTLAAMRATSPKIFPLTPNPYGTYVFE